MYQCPDSTYSNAKLLAMSTHWSKNSDYLSGSTAYTEDSTCSGDDCTCNIVSSKPTVRYWCCSDKDVGVDQNITTSFSFSANYNSETKTHKEVKKFNDYVTCDSCYAHLKVTASFEMQVTGSTHRGGYLVPDTLKRLKAAISGKVDAKFQMGLAKNTAKVTLGPVEIMAKGTKPVVSFQAVLGVVPVKIDFFLCA